MPRSVKKGPYIDYKLAEKIKKLNDTNQKKIIKTWSRSSTIFPDFVGHTIAVHNGNKMIPVYITENMGINWVSLHPQEFLEDIREQRQRKHLKHKNRI